MKKHRLITVLSAALLGLSAAALPAAPAFQAGIVAEAATTSDGFVYSVSGDKVIITGYTGSATSIAIPPEIAGKPVREIATGALRSKPITKLVIPASVQDIRSASINNCTSLKNLEIKGAAKLYQNVFAGCTALKTVKLHKDCYGHRSAFTNCPNIWTINNNAAYHYVTVNGVSKPEFTTNSYARNFIRKFFWVPEAKCKFINDYCSDLCAYVVAAETRPWMGQAVKARQLHDWIIRNCNYEDGLDQNGQQTEKLTDWDNHCDSSVFVSYGLNGVGETVCDGFSRAYTMLLAQAGIESYVLTAGLTDVGWAAYNPNHDNSLGDSHAWNLVRIDGKFYQCDVTWDDGNASPSVSPYVTNYQHFLLNRAEMDAAHSVPQGCMFEDPTIAVTGENNHPLRLVYTGLSGEGPARQAIYHFSDINSDGLLDADWGYNADWNFHGEINDTDRMMYHKLISYNPYITINNMAEHLSNLMLLGMSPQQWYDSV